VSYLPIVRDEVHDRLRSLTLLDAAQSRVARRIVEYANRALYMMHKRLRDRNKRLRWQDGSTQKSSDANEQLEYAFVLAYGEAPTSGERSQRHRSCRGFRNPVHEVMRRFGPLCKAAGFGFEFRFVD